MLGTIAIDTLLFLYATALPGIALAMAALPDRPPLELGAVGLTLGLFVVPLLHFVVAIGLGTHITPVLVAADATVLAIAGLVGWKMRRTTG